MNDVRHRDAGRLPSEEQLLMLKAALVAGPLAREAALQWLATADVERLGKSSRRLLPLLYDRLRSEGIKHPLLAVLKGVKRHTWYTNRMLFSRSSEAIRALGDAGIDVMVIKGAALTIEYYKDYSLRPMEDVDLLVRLPDARKAVEVLRQRAWKLINQVGVRGLQEESLHYAHAEHLVHPSGQDLDLHWHLLPFCVEPEADADFWAASIPATFDSQPVRVLDPADQLLHICVHGAAWDRMAPIRWIPDALAVIRMTPNLNWERLLHQARARRLTLLVQGALMYIDHNFGAIVPRDVLSRISGFEVTTFEKLEYGELIKPWTGVLGFLPRTLYMFVRISKGKTAWKTLISFPGYMRAQWRVARTVQLLSAFCRKASKKIRAAAIVSRQNDVTSSSGTTGS